MHDTRTNQHDVVVVGGGPVGAAFALALEGSPRSVLLIEGDRDAARTNDPRSLALSFGSRLLLERIGVWADIACATAIDSINVSHRGGFGRAVLTAAQAGVPALGYVVSYVALQRALAAGVRRASNIVTLQRARATSLEGQANAVYVAVEADGSQRVVQASLVVIADGGALAQQTANIEVRDYGQSAVVANVTTSRGHRNVAYERFTQMARLRCCREQGYAMVWTTSPEDAAQLSKLSEPALLAKLQTTFGDRAGRFVACDDRVVFPLSLRVARKPSGPRTVLLGNAAQALHPVAGQGLNLGLRDAWDLAQCVRAAKGDAGDEPMIAAFQRARRSDRAATIFLTDLLARIFSNDRFALRWLRGCGLTFLDCLPPAKRAFIRQMTFGRPY